MLHVNEIKQKVSEEAVQLIQHDMIVGIGSGSTVDYFIIELGKKVKQGLKCIAVPASTETFSLAKQQGITLVELNEVSTIDLTIDGADEIDQQLQLIKGGGGALLQEKMVAAASKQLVIIADNSKLKPTLGTFPLPVEVIPYGWKQLERHIHERYGIKTMLRQKNSETYITDHGHYILDCHFDEIKKPDELNQSLHLIPGIIETGLFINMCNMAIIGYPDGNVQQIQKSSL